MKLNTPQAIRIIKSSKKNTLVIDGEIKSILQAMSIALNYHKLEIKKTDNMLIIYGLLPVTSYVIGSSCPSVARV